MRSITTLLGVALATSLLSGCVERKYIITSEPPGAVVYVNNMQIGATPVENNFTYYGDYEITLVKEGYQTKTVKQNIPAPWYEYIGIDFFSENIWPYRELDVHRLPTYTLEPIPAVRTDVLLDEAQRLRARGQAIVPPASAPAAMPAFVGPPAPPTPGPMPSAPVAAAPR